MYIFNYALILFLIIFEGYIFWKVLKSNIFLKNDIYISQFLIEGLLMFILGNIMLFFTINFFGKSQAFVNHFFRIGYLLILCKGTLLIASYTFSYLSISKKTDIVVHILLILAYMVPILMIVCTPIYASIVDSLPISSIPKVFSENSLENLENPSFIKDIYMYILGYDQGGVFFNKIALVGWAFVIFAYIAIIVSTAVKHTRIHAKKIEFYYLYQILLIYIILSLFLVGKPTASCIYITYYTKMVFEVLLFLGVYSIAEKSKEDLC